jgi:hypothetical protein
MEQVFQIHSLNKKRAAFLQLFKLHVNNVID